MPDLKTTDVPVEQVAKAVATMIVRRQSLAVFLRIIHGIWRVRKMPIGSRYILIKTASRDFERGLNENTDQWPKNVSFK